MDQLNIAWLEMKLAQMETEKAWLALVEAIIDDPDWDV